MPLANFTSIFFLFHSGQVDRDLIALISLSDVYRRYCAKRLEEAWARINVEIVRAPSPKRKKDALRNGLLLACKLIAFPRGEGHAFLKKSKSQPISACSTLCM